VRTESCAAPISVLLVSRDSTDIGLVTEAMSKFGISVTRSGEMEALELVRCQKFDAAVVDFDVPFAGMILDQLRTSASSKTAVTFAIVNSKSGTSSASKVGASFLLQKPLSPELVYRTLQAAYGMILQERRRYFRCPIIVPVTLHQATSTQQISGHTVNVSQSGLALSTPVALNPGTLVSMHFKLPQLACAIAAEGVVRWYRESNAGILFLALDPGSHSELCEWLSKRLEAVLKPVTQE
jgi:CheY-like chemotaxis protein